MQTILQQMTHTQWLSKIRVNQQSVKPFAPLKIEAYILFWQQTNFSLYRIVGLE